MNSIPFKRAKVKGPTLKEVKAAEEIIKRHEEAAKKATGETLVQCVDQTATGKGCNKWFPINTLEYIQTHWYVSPSGCTDGDYWKRGEGQWKCPSCGKINRLYCTPEVTNMRASFRCVKDVYQ